MDGRHRVVIVGGGFGGLHTALQLRRAPVDVTLIDRRNFHLFQPLLYQVATGGLSPANIASPLRALLRRQKNTRVLLGEAIDVDVPGRRLILSDGAVPYDTLIVAAGMRDAYFGHDEWERFAPGLKSIEDATEMRRRILFAFEAAERESDPAKVREWLTFVIVGGGPTGVELAGAVAEIAHHTLRDNFRNIDPRTAQIVLLEGADRLLLAYPPDLSAKAARALGRLRVTVRTGTLVTDITPDCVTVKTKAGGEWLAARTALWAAGVQASPLGRAIAKAAGAETDRAGRVMVANDCTVPRHSEIFVIGDLAHFHDAAGKPLPGVAPVAMQQGRYVARLIEARLRGESIGPFAYHDRGNMATIGRNAAVADLGWVRFDGYLAWLAWLFIHLIYLVEFENRLLVLLQWGWNYFTRNRAARLITGRSDSSFRDMMNR
ncbi:MAG TPA: NAD(P)/FAD-dependent oxidoreductase [Gemmataceae bacterium]|nr:NAD(P)/FAD-dependent oxidoreductase [Gemmataceae bacterium]